MLLTSTSPCNGDPIVVNVCGNCTNATIRATTTWGVDTSVGGVPASDCPALAPVLSIDLPVSFPTGPNTHTINVYANGTLIGSFTWPSATEYFGCL